MQFTEKTAESVLLHLLSRELNIFGEFDNVGIEVCR
jgi:hypothetical protein